LTSRSIARSQTIEWNERLGNACDAAEVRMEAVRASFFEKEANIETLTQDWICCAVGTPFASTMTSFVQQHETHVQNENLVMGALLQMQILTVKAK
jgi:predicted oxidoreductase (fatty acid repression mutant protein)